MVEELELILYFNMIYMSLWLMNYKISLSKRRQIWFNLQDLKYIETFSGLCRGRHGEKLKHAISDCRQFLRKFWVFLANFLIVYRPQCSKSTKSICCWRYPIYWRKLQLGNTYLFRNYVTFWTFWSQKNSLDDKNELFTLFITLLRARGGAKPPELAFFIKLWNTN